jgi:elongation factor Ts
MINQIKKLREETGVSVIECKKALKEANGDIEKAKEVLKRWGKELAKKKKERITAQGIVDSYIHPNKKIGVLLELNCETDFVAKSPDFQALAHEICLQIAGVGESETELLSQPWIKDETKTIKELIDEYIAKTGENVTVKRFIRYSL